MSDAFRLAGEERDSQSLRKLVGSAMGVFTSSRVALLTLLAAVIGAPPGLEGESGLEFQAPVIRRL